ncbi:MAG: THUMP domain-containing protein, partial [Clostridia bacterium]
MEKSLIIRYSEIHLKGKNIRYFENMLLRNIKNSLKGISCTAMFSRSRYVVENYDINDEFEIIERLKRVFGIHSVSSAYIVHADFETIKETVLKCVTFSSGTFKIETNRADKNFPMTSPQISSELGGCVLDEFPNLKVDVRQPEHVISVDIRET